MDINSFFDKIFIISLFHSEDRINSLKDRLDKHGITNYKIIDAYVGEMFEILPVSHSFTYGGNAMGCLLSHLRCLKEGLYYNYDNILILEDDVLLHKDFNNQFKIITNDLGGRHWDLLYLGHQTLKQQKSNVHEQFYEENKHIFKANNSWGGHAYGVSKNLMKFYYETFTKDFGNWVELDMFLVNSVQNIENFKCFKVYPQLFIQHDGYSEITKIERTNFRDLLNKGYTTNDDYE